MTSVDAKQGSSSRVRPLVPHLPFRRMSFPANTTAQAPLVTNVAPLYSGTEAGDCEAPPLTSPDPQSHSFSPPQVPTPSPRISPLAKAGNHRRRSVVPSQALSDAVSRSKRRKVCQEFLETERSYLRGLDLIYDHFLIPLVLSLNTASPILSRTELTSVFSNFVDIWNLHRSFCSSLASVVAPPEHQPSDTYDPAPLSPIFTSHFPYLSLYTPFVTSFPDALASLSALMSSNNAFSYFIRKQEEDQICGKLGLRSWLLTIVQRCPRYSLLINDLLHCTPEADPEHAELISVHNLVLKILQSMNSSLLRHEETLNLLALQRSTSDLPIKLVSPGRTFLKQGSLLKADREYKFHDFLLFSDCLIWLAHVEGVLHYYAEVIAGDNRLSTMLASQDRSGESLSRCKSEAQLPKSRSSMAIDATPRRFSQSNQWTFKGHIDLVDIEVVANNRGASESQCSLDILSPHESFTLFAANSAERDEWMSAIREAKASLLMSLNVMNPDSTLTSSTSNIHVRRALRALPHPPEETHAKPKRRGMVDHFLPAIWVPDSNTTNCQRCGRAFGWTRRRHHCRLCGRCVCVSCSNRTFYIADGTSNSRSKPARACNTCYDTVFPATTGSSSAESELAMESLDTFSGPPAWHTQRGDRNSAPSVLSLLNRKSLSDEGSHNHRLSTGYVVEDDSYDAENQRVPALEDNIEPGPSSVVRRRPGGRETHDISKRYSTPAMALQTVPVTTHAERSKSGRRNRLSLVLTGRSQDSVHNGEGPDVGKGMAVRRLQELLAKQPAVPR
ncbi:Dbl homology domain-containing protein [Sistotremastrum niveocremeum HHB9708]|uniref:Dbl homology domain-containing protein n=1 Tax=Sistotremastrum niveocremeum HHB9708 TaxID=1314777 RepID=A0A164UM97_9AGAM|nr:Dbl homology domain-containing protein [Sistotremastrum niveocremeum HHB9708]